MPPTNRHTTHTPPASQLKIILTLPTLSNIKTIEHIPPHLANTRTPKQSCLNQLLKHWRPSWNVLSFAPARHPPRHSLIHLSWSRWQLCALTSSASLRHAPWACPRRTFRSARSAARLALAVCSQLALLSLSNNPRSHKASPETFSTRMDTVLTRTERCFTTDKTYITQLHI